MTGAGVGSRGPREPSPEVDVVVVGAGVVGCAIARALARDRTVCLLDADAIGSGASGRSLGLVTTAAAYANERAIADHALSWFRSLAGVAFDERVSLEPAPPGDERIYRRRADRLAAAGGAVSFVEPTAIRERHPRLRLPDAAGVLQYEDIGLVDPGQMVGRLADDARRRGVTIRTGTPATGLRTAERDDTVDRITGVETTSGPVGAETVVVAGGWRTPDLLDGHVTLPIRPYRTQAVELALPTALPQTFPALWHPGERFYLREAGGNLWVGGGAHPVDDPDGASRSADGSFRRLVARVVPEHVTGTGDAVVRFDWAGVDGGTPDGRPVVDAVGDGPPAGRTASEERVPGPDGLVVAAGFHGMGIGLAPVAAGAVRSLVTGDSAPFPLDRFALDRFEERSREFEFPSIEEGTDDSSSR